MKIKNSKSRNKSKVEKRHKKRKKKNQEKIIYEVEKSLKKNDKLGLSCAKLRAILDLSGFN